MSLHECSCIYVLYVCVVALCCSLVTVFIWHYHATSHNATDTHTYTHTRADSTHLRKQIYLQTILLL